MRICRTGMMAAVLLAGAAGAAIAQDHGAALGGSMGTEAAAAPRSASGDAASGAHHTPVARAQRHHARHATHGRQPAKGAPSGDAMPPATADPTNRH